MQRNGASSVFEEIRKNERTFVVRSFFLDDGYTSQFFVVSSLPSVTYGKYAPVRLLDTP